MIFLQMYKQVTWSILHLGSLTTSMFRVLTGNSVVVPKSVCLSDDTPRFPHFFLAVLGVKHSERRKRTIVQSARICLSCGPNFSFLNSPDTSIPGPPGLDTAITSNLQDPPTEHGRTPASSQGSDPFCRPSLHLLFPAFEAQSDISSMMIHFCSLDSVITSQTTIPNKEPLK